MKMVKSLLLGTAAGIVAVAGAQAADLPVKAKPVEYVKVCSLYGAGYYYMPGTDICIKLGGYVRAQYYAGWGSSGTANPFNGSSGLQNRLVTGNQDVNLRSRAVLTLDTRQQTEFGTLRTYTLFGYQHDAQAGSPALYATRGFIQLAGFTVGKAQSFYDIFSNPSVSYFGLAGSDTGDSGIMLAAYTAQFGNGFTGTISVEDPITRRTTISGGNEAGVMALTFGGTQGSNGVSYGNVTMPDVVGNIRVDQAWGSAQVMAAMHQARPNYWGTTEGSGHPDDKFGWVVGGGVVLNASAISPGDKFQFMVSYTEGAIRYLNQVQGGANYNFFSGSTVGFGLMTDAVAAFGGGLELTKGWQISASYDHVWNQRWKTSIYGGYMDIQYGNVANSLICGAAAAGQGCDASWNNFWVGSRTQFNINSSTYLGLDVIYQKLNTGLGGFATTVSGNGKSGVYTFADQDAVSATFRVHRDFLP